MAELDESRLAIFPFWGKFVVIKARDYEYQFTIRNKLCNITKLII